MKKLLLIFSLISFSVLGAEKVTIKDAKTLKVLQVAEFEGSKAKQEWLDMLAKDSAWGKAAHKKCEDKTSLEVEPVCVDVPSEYTVEITDITAEVEQQRINIEALQYLASTDWLIVREVETQVVCSADIKLERAAARLRIK